MPEPVEASSSVGNHAYFIDRALQGMTTTLTELGDDLVVQRPDLPGANTPYGLVTHCLGVMEYWAGHVIAGRAVQRDRAGEFRARGAVAELVAKVDAARLRLGGSRSGPRSSMPSTVAISGTQTGRRRTRSRPRSPTGCGNGSAGTPIRSMFAV